MAKGVMIHNIFSRNFLKTILMITFRVDMSDLAADRIIMFQHKYYIPLAVIANVAFPVGVLHFFLHESILMCLMFGVMTRYVITLHGTWLINSAAHMYGMKPFDSSISPVDNKLISMIALGEGFHNYHVSLIILLSS